MNPAKQRLFKIQRQPLPLILIVCLALALRLWGVQFGLPYAYHVDEPAYVSAALNLGAGIVGRQPNPTGFSNLLFVQYGFYFLVGKLMGLFPSLADFERSYRSDPSIFLLLARLTTASLGALNIAVVYWLGREIRSQLVGLLAAIFLSVSFLHVRDSHYGVPDVAMTFFVSLSVLFCILAIRQPKNWKLQYAAAVACGFAIATKWSALFVIVPFFLLILYVWFGQNTTRAIGFSPRMLASHVLLMGGFLVGSFQLLLQPRTFLEYALREARAGEAGGFGVWQIDTVPGWWFYLKTLSYGLGAVLLTLAILGCLHHLYRVLRTRDPISFILLAFPLAYYLAMGTTRHYFARYALPFVPFLALFAAGALFIAVKWLESRRVWLGWGLVITFTILSISQPLAASIRHNLLLTRQDTRTWAKQWIESHIPARAKIAVDWPWYGPPLSTPDSMSPYSDKVYDVSLIGETGLSEHSLAWYRDQGFDYLIASSFIYDIPLVHEELDSERRAFYANLDHQLELVQEFQPSASRVELPFIFDEIYGPAISLWQRDRPGPMLKVYRIR